MSEPVVGYRSIITALNVGEFWGFLVVPGFPPAALANGLTFDRFRANQFSAIYMPIITVDAGSAVECDYVGIASHNLADYNSEITIYGNTVPFGTGTPTVVATITKTAGSGNSPILKLFTPATFRYWAVQLEKTDSPYTATFDIGVLYIGKRLTFERCIMKSHAPSPLNRRTDFYDNASESGQFLGRSILRRGFETSVSPDMMTAAWVRSDFQPFVKAARLSPYFFAWNPGAYPDEVVFGRTKEDIGAEYTGDRDRMKSAWKVEGLGYDD